MAGVEVGDEPRGRHLKPLIEGRVRLDLAAAKLGLECTRCAMSRLLRLLLQAQARTLRQSG